MRGFRYLLLMLALAVSAGMRGQYNPTNPAEPGVYYTLTLQATPANGGSFNIGTTTTYSEGTSVSLRAYTNSNFKFVTWEQDGEVVSTSSSFTYIMPARNVTLVACYVYDPSSPAEPPEPDIPVYSRLTLSASPAAGGYFNISSGNSYEVGSQVSLRAYNNSNFMFVSWTEDGEVVSTSSSFTYEITEGDHHLVANYSYSPSSPGEPSEPQVLHTLQLQSSPADGGYFNTSSGNSYASGTSVYLRAYSNQWYTFDNWTCNGEVVSTAASFYFTMPDANVTLVANFTYNYDPSNPSEPSEPSNGNVNIYGMTENGARGQAIAYPIYLENPVDITGMAVDIQFPDGFAVDADNVQLAGRAIGHEMTVSVLDSNTYRFVLLGTTNFDGNNGKVFDVMVTIPDTATTNHNYPVTLSHGVAHTVDGNQEAVSARSGYIYVEQSSEDGLYARFSYDKLLGRVQFTNLSSEKALRYEWDFGDGTTSSEDSPLHTYGTPGYYDVTLTAYGEYGEDAATTTVLINDSAYWTVGGTFILANEMRGVRYFDTADSLLAFVSAATLADNITLMVEAESSFPLAMTDTNKHRLAALAEEMATQSLSLNISKTGEGANPTIAFGDSGDELTAELIELYNKLGASATCYGVTTKLCGIEYNPAMINAIADQTVNSGVATAEINFSPISNDLTFAWTLTTTPDEEAVTGYKMSGEGNIPSMTIDNIGEEDAVFTYMISASHDSLTFCEFSRSITVRPGSAILEQAEWDLLNTLREVLVDGGWQEPWDMTCGPEGASTLRGVTVERGHVTGIDLSSESIGGGFPTVALQLPRLVTLSMADNDMTGDVAKDILQDMTIYTAANPGFKSTLRSIDISGNDFTGNIGLLSALSSVFADLEELMVSDNAVCEVSPALPPSITSLDLTGQRTDSMISVDLVNFDFEAVAAQLPSIMLYDHGAQAYMDTPMLRLTNRQPGETGAQDGYWGMDIDATTGEPVLAAINTNAYEGQSGDTVFVSYPYAATEVADCHCLATINFEPGDANFIGGVTAADLQATILYAFGDYTGRPFNLTAADTYTDGTINVQDVVCTVDILLSATSGDSETMRNVQKTKAGATTSSATEADACIYIDNGNVILKSPVPVAAISVTASGNISWTLDNYGMAQASAGANLVGYSLTGLTIPAGTAVIGSCRGEAAIRNTTLADTQAMPISVSVGESTPTSIDGVQTEYGGLRIFNMNGVEVNGLQKGVNIIRKDGRSIKVINK